MEVSSLEVQTGDVCVCVLGWRKKESNQTDGYQWFLFHGFDVYG